MVNFIWVTNQKELIHRYPEAPEEVSFLRNEHRHLFFFRTYIQIFGDNRDIEFIMFKRYVQSILDDLDVNQGMFSCEMISNFLHGLISEKFPGRHIKIEVSEDGENGALYDYPVES